MLDLQTFLHVSAKSSCIRFRLSLRFVIVNHDITTTSAARDAGRIMQSKFPGNCRDCDARIMRGETISYHGRGNGVSCAQCIGQDRNEQDEDESAGFEPGTLASDRSLARRGLTVVRFSSGGSFTRSSRGRCEDAPCCGCCS